MDCSATIASTPSTKHAGMVTNHTRRICRTILDFNAFKTLVHARTERRCGRQVRGGERHLQQEVTEHLHNGGRTLGNRAAERV